MNYFRYYIIALLMLLRTNTGAQVITTFAGTGAGGTASGDGGLATAAVTALPGFGCFDSSGNYYFGEDYLHPRIRKVTTAGLIYTVAGNGVNGFSGDGGQATDASFSNAVCTVDAAGNIFIADYYNKRLRKVDVATGIIHTICGNGIADTSGDGGPATAATTQPQEVLVDGYGNIFIDDFYKTRKINTAGIITTIAHISGSGGMCFDSVGNLYIGSALRIMKIDTATGHIDTLYGTGTYLYNGDGIHADSANFRSDDIVMDKIGNIYLADVTNNRIRKIDTFGIIHTVAGNGIAAFYGEGVPATAAEVYNPEGVALDVCGNLYIADEANNRIRKITIPPKFSITTMPNDTICAGYSVTFTGSIISGGVAGSTTATYQWYINGILTTATAGTFHYDTPASGDSVLCIVTDITPCGDTFVLSSNTVHLVVDSLFTPTISLAAPSYGIIGNVITVNATVAGAGSSYIINWYNKGIFFASTTVPIVTYTKAMVIDSITARVISISVGCYDSVLSALHVVNDSALGVSLSPSPLERAGVRLYPNPAGNTVNIISTITIDKIEIMDILGKTFITQNCSTKSQQVSISQLPPGLYFVRVNGAEMARFVKSEL